MNIKLNLDLKNIDEEIHKLDILDRDTIIQLYVLSLKRIDRLNNIINELEKWLEQKDDELYSFDFRVVLDKLEELRGEDK